MGRPGDQPTKNPKPNINEDHDLERGDLLNSDIPEWLQEFRENLLDDTVPEHRDSRPKCDFIHPRQLSPFPERLVLPFSNEVILSFYEELDSSGNDLFTSSVK